MAEGRLSGLTGVVVAALAKPDWLMEIDVIAVLP